jgi:hypothetical protein
MRAKDKEKGQAEFGPPRRRTISLIGCVGDQHPSDSFGGEATG